MQRRVRFHIASISSRLCLLFMWLSMSLLLVLWLSIICTGIALWVIYPKLKAEEQQQIQQSFDSIGPWVTYLLSWNSLYWFMGLMVLGLICSLWWQYEIWLQRGYTNAKLQRKIMNDFRRIWASLPAAKDWPGIIWEMLVDHYRSAPIFSTMAGIAMVLVLAVMIFDAVRCWTTGIC